MPKRPDYLSWDDYFMGIAVLSAERSKDPNRQVGACIVNGDRKTVGIGYNGFPDGCPDERLPWAGKEVFTGSSLEAADVAGMALLTKYPYVCHAELNAIVNATTANLKGCTLYVTLFPCCECTKLVIQSGIRHIIFLDDKGRDDPVFVASRRMLDLAGVKYTRHEPSVDRIHLDFGPVAPPTPAVAWGALRSALPLLAAAGLLAVMWTRTVSRC
eukprot:EG_transcript_21778